MASRTDFEILKQQIDADRAGGFISEEEARQRLLELYYAFQSKENRPATDILGTEPFIPENTGGVPDISLRASSDPRAVEELARREEIASGGLIDNFDNPEYWRRILGAAAKSPAQMVVGATQGVPALASLGLEALTGQDFNSEQQLMDLQTSFEDIGRRFNVSEPINTAESIAEAAVSAITPGGFFAKAGAVGIDFTIDQAVRELTDTRDSGYRTVFDQVGLADSDGPTLGPLGAVAVGIGAGTLSATAISRLSKARMARPPRKVPVRDLDPSGPDKLMSIETSGDLYKTYFVDEQQTLADIAERAGVPNLQEVTDSIDFNTHSAARTRIQEAMNTGQLSTSSGAIFNTPVSPRMLYEAYGALDDAKRQDVATYINLLDMMDDARIAITKNVPGNHHQQLAILQRQAAGIAQRTPEAITFQRDYSRVTGAVRTFLEDGLFTSKFKQQLDLTRPNYVPLEIIEVDPSAPLLQRLSQVQNNEPGIRDDWFLRTRNSTGAYDITKRGDPFELLIDYTEAALTRRMQNDAKVTYVDALLNSQYGADTIRKIDAGEAEQVQGRIVSIYRNGVKEDYVTSKLVANLLKFDPYVAKYPALFIPKRIAEQAMVGPLSITFAPVTMIRDTIGAYAVRPGTISVGNPLQVAAAVPKQLWQKAKIATANSIRAKLAAGQTLIPTTVVSAADQAKWADDIADSYMNSIYHLMNEGGGFDASLMKSRIEVATGTMREIQRSIENNGFLQNPVFNNVVTRFGARRVHNLISGFVELFSSIQEAPRYAAIENTLRTRGGSIPDVVRDGRKITGDVTRSGRAVDPDGNLIRGDAVDQGLQNYLATPFGHTTEVLREATPFMNPMIQGTRRLLQSFADDPVGTNIRAWTAVGLPSVAAYGWNEMLGAEYNDYAMDRRSARDVAMNLYIGLPDRPPEEGLEIPLMHELLFYGAPFTRTLHGWARGEGAQAVQASMGILADEILSNSLDIGFPTTGALAMNAMGLHASDSLTRPADGVYSIREDGIGFLPQNIEEMARTLFAANGQVAIETAYALGSEEPDFEGWYDNIVTSLVSRTPIVRNLAGARRANTYFSLPMDYSKERFDAFNEFLGFYNAFYEPKRQVEGEEGIRKPSSENGYDSAKGQINEEEDLPFRMIGPNPMSEPTNPLYPIIGGMLTDYVNRNQIGMRGIQDRLNKYSTIAAQLRDYNATNRQAIKDWQKALDTSDVLSDESRRMKELLQQHEIDLSDYYDRVKLINLIEAERSKLITVQLQILDQVEQEITQMLRDQGVLDSATKFDIRKHLKPFSQNPFGRSPNGNRPL